MPGLGLRLRSLAQIPPSLHAGVAITGPGTLLTGLGVRGFAPVPRPDTLFQFGDASVARSRLLRGGVPICLFVRSPRFPLQALYQAQNAKKFPTAIDLSFWLSFSSTTLVGARVRSFLIVPVLAAWCAGCAIKPLPQDVTGNDTYQIVQKIRCETRDAVRSFILGVLDQSDPETAAGLRKGTLTFGTVNRKKLSSEAQAALDKYDQAAIAYDFTFDITEKNDVSANLDFLRTFSRGPFTLGVSGSNERQRQNTRNFRVTDSFEELATKVSDDYCVDGRVPPNYVYPITGSIGMIELVGTFLDLNQSGNLAGPKDSPNVPQVADTVAFTTTFGGSVNPKIVLTPLSKGFDLADASLTADASRSDVHKVIVALSLPPEKKKTIKAAQASAKAAANSMVDYQVYRNLTNRGFIVLPGP
jgi:hypothetical protein